MFDYYIQYIIIFSIFPLFKRSEIGRDRRLEEIGRNQRLVEIGRERKRAEESGRDRKRAEEMYVNTDRSAFLVRKSIDISFKTINPVVLLVKKGKFIACGKGKYNESHIGTVEDTEHNVCKELLA